MTAFVVVNAGGPGEQRMVVADRLFVGRECSGVDELHRLVLDDPDISRFHLEIRLEPERSRACVVDTSTNGTRLNGVRVDRAVTVTLKSGDRLEVGSVELVFYSDEYRQTGEIGRPTRRRIQRGVMAMVVGDIADFSAIAQRTTSDAVASSVDALFGAVRQVLAGHRGTLANYVGDAVFAVWELDRVEDAVARAVTFALDAAFRVGEIAPELPMRQEDGKPVRMGWGAVLGDAATTPLSGSPVAVLGDSTNLAFRLAGLAGRDGRPAVLATAAVYGKVADMFVFEGPEPVQVKGRQGVEMVYGVSRRTTER